MKRIKLALLSLTNPKLLQIRVMTAVILRKQRHNAGLSLRKAAQRSGLNAASLLKYELGLKSPALNKLYRLLMLYRADDEAIFYFCCLPMSKVTLPGRKVNSLPITFASR